QYEIRQPAAWDALEWSPQWRAMMSRSDAICFGTLAQRAPQVRLTVQKCLQNAPEPCLKVLDINLRRPFYTRAVIENSLRMATILKLNDAELAEIAAMFGIRGADKHVQMTELLRKFDLECVLVTLGERGAMAANAAEIVEHEGFKVDVSDT